LVGIEGSNPSFSVPGEDSNGAAGVVGACLIIEALLSKPRRRRGND